MKNLIHHYMLYAYSVQYLLGQLSRPDIATGNIVKGYHHMYGDIIIVGKFVQMVVGSYQLQRLI